MVKQKNFNILTKIRVFTWRFPWNILPTKSHFISKNVQVGNGCYLCGEDTKEVWHLFNSCQYFRAALGGNYFISNFVFLYFIIPNLYQIN